MTAEAAQLYAGLLPSPREAHASGSPDTAQPSLFFFWRRLLRTTSTSAIYFRVSCTISWETTDFARPQSVPEQMWGWWFFPYGNDPLAEQFWYRQAGREFLAYPGPVCLYLLSLSAWFSNSKSQLLLAEYRMLPKVRILHQTMVIQFSTLKGAIDRSLTLLISLLA